MPKLKLPPRQPTGDPGNIERAVAVQRRLQELGKRYRISTPKESRSYRAWLEFLAGYEPTLISGTVEFNEAVYKAAPRK